MTATPILPTYQQLDQAESIWRGHTGFIRYRKMILCGEGDNGKDLKTLRPYPVEASSDLDVASKILKIISGRTWSEDDLAEHFDEFVVSRWPINQHIKIANIKLFRKLKPKHFKWIRQFEDLGCSVRILSGDRSRRIPFKLEMSRNDLGFTISSFGNLYEVSPHAEDHDEPFGVNLYPATIHSADGWRVDVEKDRDGYRTRLWEGDRLVQASTSYKTARGARKYADKLVGQQRKFRAPVDWLAGVHPDEADFYAGRAERRTKRRQSLFANPYVVGKDGSLEECLNAYREYLHSDRYLLSELRKLKGQKAGCFCCRKGDRLNIDDPLRCHVQVMAQTLRELENEGSDPSTLAKSAHDMA